MKIIDYVDEKGYKRRRMLPDNDDNINHGIILEPPSLDDLPIDEILRDLHNALMDLEIYRVSDFGNGLQNAILTAVKPHLAKLYKIQISEMEVDKNA